MKNSGNNSSKPLYELRSVTKILANEAVPVTLLRDISFSLPRGQNVAITGPSGSGKSSLIYLLGLLDSPSEGEIFFDGEAMSAVSESQKERYRLEKIGFMFQFHFLLQEFTAAENLLLPMRKLGVKSAKAMNQRVDELLNYFNVGDVHKKYPGQLSGGQRQRVALARSLANDPIVLLADEPTGNLDTENAKNVFDLFEKLSKDFNKTVVTITHDAALAARAALQIRIVDGKLSLK